MPTPILDIQRRHRELGRIRTGEKATAPSGATRPAKLATFRLTSPSRALILEAAGVYGGDVAEWRPRESDPVQYEVVTQTDTLDIAIPPIPNYLYQAYELWTAAGCQRRCDGAVCEARGQDGTWTERQCLCPPNDQERITLAKKGQACAEVTRLKVILTKLQTFGFWRLDTRSYHALTEMAGAAEMLSGLSARGLTVPARLVLDQRTSREPGQPVKMYAVPRIEVTFNAPVGEVLESSGLMLGAPASRGQLPEAAPLSPPLPAGEGSGEGDVQTSPGQQPSADATWDQPTRRPPRAGSVIPAKAGTKRLPAPAPYEPGKPGPIPAQAGAPDAPQTTITDDQVRTFAIRCREAGLTDDGRHTLVHTASAGRVTSSKDLTPAELNTAYTQLTTQARQDTIDTLKKLGVASKDDAAATLHDWLPDAPDTLNAWGAAEWLKARTIALDELAKSTANSPDGSAAAPAKADATPAKAGAQPNTATTPPTQAQMDTGIPVTHAQH